jgi:hypothetical protein
MVQCIPLDVIQAQDYGIVNLSVPKRYPRLCVGDSTPDDRSGSMTVLRRNQSQNRLLLGRVCLVIRAVRMY